MLPSEMKTLTQLYAGQLKKQRIKTSRIFGLDEETTHSSGAQTERRSKRGSQTRQLQMDSILGYSDAPQFSKIPDSGIGKITGGQHSDVCSWGKENRQSLARTRHMELQGTFKFGAE